MSSSSKLIYVMGSGNHARTYLHLDPRSALAHSNLVNVLEQQGDTRGAIEQYCLALEKDPGLDQPHLGLPRKHFELAAGSADPAVRSAAQEALRKIQALDRRE